MDRVDMTGRSIRVVLAACLLAAAPWTARAQDAEAVHADSLASDLHEEIVRVAVTVQDRFGRAETLPMPITIYRPDGDGPFPFVVFSHGRAPPGKRAAQGRSRPEALARYFVGKGFAVLAPTRVGYWETYGRFDPEETGNCNDLRLEGLVDSTSSEALAAVAYARSLRYVDAGRWLAVGQSVGGLAAVATVALKPAGLIGGINFAGGIGGDPERHPTRPCSPQRVQALYRQSGGTTTVPMLWMYWANDQFWGETVPKTWFAAWQDAGGRGVFDQFAARGDDGHSGVNIDLDHWVPTVDAFLMTLGFPPSPPLRRPPATRYAALAAVDRLPAASAPAQAAYRKFLEAAAPRAFAVGDRGAFGYAVDDAVMVRALGSCARSGQQCKLYAVDDDVVWP